jgi:GNAT superfamily N-acetyltransferase
MSLKPDTPKQMAPDFYISTDKNKLDISLIVDFLTNRSYWAKDRTEEAIRKSIHNSFSFGLYSREGALIGFARVVSDFAVFAWLMDVFILEDYQGKGLGKKLMQEIISHPDLKDVKRWGLGTRDAHELYKKFGFTTLLHPEVMMEKVIT